MSSPSSSSRGSAPRAPLPPRRPWVAFGLLGVFGLGLTAALVLVGLFAYYGRDLPDVHGLRASWRPPQTTRVLDRRGELLAELFTERRTVVPLERLPEHLVKALLAAEDADFYRHRGLDWPGMVRALWINLRRGTVAQGASTITQQVVKNVVLGGERTLARKVREVLLARRIERDLQKNEILFLYVNHIAFGHGRNGVEEAARFYFGRSVSTLTLGESALLAGIPKSPVRYSPRNNLDLALRRRRWILAQMVEKGFVTQQQADQAAAEPVRLVDRADDEGLAPEAVEVARRVLVQLAGPEALERGGYTVRTTLDRGLQRMARQAVVQGLTSLDARQGFRGPLSAPGARRPRGAGNVVRAERPPRDGQLLPGRIYTGVVESAEDGDARHPGALRVRVGQSVGTVPWTAAAQRYAAGLAPSRFAPVGAVVRVGVDQRITPETTGTMRLELGPQAALVAIDPRAREVLALVGGRDAIPGMFNRATRAQRQVGSAFKPVLFSFGLSSRRFTLASLVDPNPGCFGAGPQAWCPAEAHAQPGVVEPPMRLREALAQSRNMVAARLMEALGPEAVVSHARALGITAPMPQDLSLALGSGSVTPIELTNAYATWAAGGTYQDWQLITEVRDPSGRVLPLPARPAPRQAMGPAEAWLVTSAMTTVVERGTARAARSLGRPVAGKTGTTDRARDAWFVGYTPELVTGVWVGFDDRQPLGPGEEGARSALPLWTQFVRAYLRDRHPPALEFARPQGITAVAIDPATGLPPALGAVMAPGAAAATLEEYFLTGTEPQPPAVPVDAGVVSDVPTVAPDADDPAAPPSELSDAGPESLVAPSADAGDDDDDVPPPSTAAPSDPGLVLPLQ